MEVILKVCHAEDRVIQDPKPKVFVKEFADSGLIYILLASSLILTKVF
jgi:small-conductance mechanosensitive channel